MRGEDDMPTKCKRPCAYHGCPELVEYGERYCKEHKKVIHKNYDKYNRDKGRHSLYGSRWQKESKRFLVDNPLCEDCKEKGILEPATEVHHIIRHNGDYELFWDRTNWKAICKVCHSIRTSKGE